MGIAGGMFKIAGMFRSGSGKKAKGCCGGGMRGIKQLLKKILQCLGCGGGKGRKRCCPQMRCCPQKNRGQNGAGFMFAAKFKFRGHA